MSAIGNAMISRSYSHVDESAEPPLTFHLCARWRLREPPSVDDGPYAIPLPQTRP